MRGRARPRQAPRPYRAPRRPLPTYTPSRPGTPDYAERHREFVVQLPGGLTRIDLGEPCPAPGRVISQVAVEAPEEPAVTVSAPVETAAVGQPAWPERDWRGDYGLSKNG